MATLRAAIDARGATVGAAEFRRAAGSMTTAGSGLTSMLTRLGASFGVTFAFRKIVSDAAAGQKALAQLRAGLASTAGSSGQTEESLVALSNEMQRTTVFADNLVQSASAVMLSFTQISGDVFPRAIRVAGDVATRMGTDLQNSVVQLSKALNDPVANLGALSRAGIQFTKVQKEMIKELWEAGEQMEAQNVILKELEVQYGGSAAAARDTLGGALTDMKNSLSDMSEEIGNTLTPAIVASGKAVSASFKGLEAMFKDARRFIREVGGSIPKFETEIQAKFGGKITDEELEKFRRKVRKSAKEPVKMLQKGETPITSLAELSTPEEELDAIRLANRARAEARDRARQREMEIIGRGIEDIRVSMLSEVDLAEEAHAQRLAVIQRAREEGLQLGVDYDSLEEAIKQEHNDKMLAMENAVADARDQAFADEVDADKRRTDAIIENRKRELQQKMATANSWTSYLVQMTAAGAKQSREMFEINKAASIANVVMSTAAGIQRAWADLPPWAAGPMTAVIAAAGITQLNAIRGTTFGGGGTISSGGGAAAAAGGGGPAGGGGTTTEGGGGGTREVNITVAGGDSITTSTLRDLMERISDESDDGSRMRVLT